MPTFIQEQNCSDGSTDALFSVRRFIRRYSEAWVPSVITVGSRPHHLTLISLNRRLPRPYAAVPSASGAPRVRVRPAPPPSALRLRCRSPAPLIHEQFSRMCPPPDLGFGRCRQFLPGAAVSARRRSPGGAPGQLPHLQPLVHVHFALW
jgi:hypothetical protein